MERMGRNYYTHSYGTKRTLPVKGLVCPKVLRGKEQTAFRE